VPNHGLPDLGFGYSGVLRFRLERIQNLRRARKGTQLMGSDGRI
jgi:hypothetical protein